MADNTQLPVAATSGDIIRDEDIGGGVKMPVSKIHTGADGVDGGSVTPLNRFPVEDSQARNQLEDINVALIVLLEALQTGVLQIQTLPTRQDNAGAAPLVPPSLAGGIDTTGKLRSLLTDVLGRQYMLTQGQAAVAAAIAAAQNPVYTGLSDGTNVRAVLGDTSGRAMAVGAAATGATVANAGNPIVVAGSDGVNSRSLRTDTAGELYLVCDAIPGAAVPAVACVTAGKDEAGLTRTVATDRTGVQAVQDNALVRSLDDLGNKVDQMIRIMQLAFNVEG
jgi:hypothetical protein